jgi:predicted nucleotidyltransferase
MTSCTQQLPEALNAVAPALRGVISVHVFGSELYDPEPKDLDLLVVYDATHTPPHRATALRTAVVGACRAITQRPVDVVLLTEAEAEATRFVSREQAELVYRQAPIS